MDIDIDVNANADVDVNVAVDAEVEVEVDATMRSLSPTECDPVSFDGLDSKSAVEVTILKPNLDNIADGKDIKAAQHTTVHDAAENDLPVKLIDNGNNSGGSGISCAFASHHYHYIDYPSTQYQVNNNKHTNLDNDAAMPQAVTSNGYHYCACSCMCDGHAQMPLRNQTQPFKPSDSRVAVAAIVHRQAIDADCNLRTKSEQSLLSHSYQMLNIPPDNKSPSNVNLNCAALECNCSTAACTCHSNRKRKSYGGQTNVDSMLATADEITVSESDNNGSMTKRKNMRESRVHKKINSWYEKNYNCNHIESYNDVEETDANHPTDAIITHDGITNNALDQRPPLPPRPHPSNSPRSRPINTSTVMQFVQYSVGPPPPPCTWVPQPDSRIPATAMAMAHRPGSHSIKKYVIWCLVCGGFSCLLGALFLGVYFLLHSYTISVGNFETVPTFVPATLLILTGLCIMSLARRRNRYSYLIKLSGACGLISALTCALVTVTTTVLHMSRLQALRECEYAQKTRTCTCYSDMIESQMDRVEKEGVRLVFDSLSDCGVVHGSLYSCLRAIFGLSVAGVLTAVFSCMLVYQLLSHERKKMYWEQLELRCRSLYTSHQQQSHQPGAAAHTMAAMSGIGARGSTICRCCEQCHAHRQLQLQTATYPWVDDTGESRFWTGQPPGNFYSPNPGGDDNNVHTHAGGSNRNRVTTGWSWPRMPWQRSSTESTNRFRQIPSSPDSQYGFSSNNPSLGLAVSNVAVTSTADEDAAAAAVAAVAAATATQRAAQAYNIISSGAALPYGVWGPPPPYSDPNSPARRGYYQFIQPANNIYTGNRGNESSGVGSSDEILQQRPLSAGPLNTLTTDSTANIIGPCMAQRTFEQMSQRICAKEQSGGASLSNEYGNTCSDSDADNGGTTRLGDRFSNTLPTRKIKKRTVDGTGSIAKCVGSAVRQVPSHRINVQRVFPSSSNSTSENDTEANGNGNQNGNGNGNIRTMNNIRNGYRNGHSHNHNHNHSNNKDSRVAAQSVATVATVAGANNSSNNRVQHPDEMENNGFFNNRNCNPPANNDGAVDVIVTDCDVPYEDPTESEIYFADVSSCCNMSMKNDNCYEDACRNANQSNAPHGHSHVLHQTTQCNLSRQNQQQQQQQQHLQQQQQQHHHLHQIQQLQHHRNICNHAANNICCGPAAEHIAQNFSQREGSIRSRGHSQFRDDENYKKKLNVMQMKATGQNSGKLENKNDLGIPKDVSLNSMCSIESETKTECTDLSPSTPCNNQLTTQVLFQCQGNNNPTATNANGLSNFIASFPYASESKFHEAHRRLTKTIQDNVVTGNATAVPQEAHYEVITEDGLKTITSNSIPMRLNPTAISPNTQQRQQRQKNLNPNCNYNSNSNSNNNKSPMGRVTSSRNVKSKDNLDAVWTTSDPSGSNHHRQRL